MFLSFNAAIWLYPKPVDFRKQMDGLVMLVADHLQLNPTSGQLFSDMFSAFLLMIFNKNLWLTPRVIMHAFQNQDRIKAS